MTAGVEAALVALLGGVAGLVAWKLAVPVSDRLAVGPVSWWAEDVQVSWSAIVTMMVAIVVTTVVTVQLGLRRVAVSPLAARTEPAAAKPRLIRLLPLLAGLAALLVNVVVVEPWPTNRWFITFGGANILFVVGLIVALPLSGRLASTLVGFAGHRPWAALASARIRHEPGLVARTTAGLLTMTIVAGFALAVAVSLQMAVESTVGRPGDGRLRLEVSTAPVDQESLTSLDGVIHAVPVVATNIDGVWLRAYRADCQQVSAVATTVTGECGSGLLQPTTVVFPEWEAALGTLPGPPVSFEFDWPDGSRSEPAEVVAPPSVPLVHPAPTRWILEVDRGGDLDRLASEILGLAPGAVIWGLPAPDRGRLIATYNALVLAGMATGTLLTFLAALAGVADRTLERRRSANHLAALGVPGPVLRRAEALAVTGPLVVGMVVAVLVSTLSVRAYTRLGGRGVRLPTETMLVLPAIAVVAIAVIGVTGYLLAGPRLDPECLRSE